MSAEDDLIIIKPYSGAYGLYRSSLLFFSCSTALCHAVNAQRNANGLQRRIKRNRKRKINAKRDSRSSRARAQRMTRGWQRRAALAHGVWETAGTRREGSGVRWLGPRRAPDAILRHRDVNSGFEQVRVGRSGVMGRDVGSEAYRLNRYTRRRRAACRANFRWGTAVTAARRAGAQARGSGQSTHHWKGAVLSGQCPRPASAWAGPRGRAHPPRAQPNSALNGKKHRAHANEDCTLQGTRL